MHWYRTLFCRPTAVRWPSDTKKPQFGFGLWAVFNLRNTSTSDNHLYTLPSSGFTWFSRKTIGSRMYRRWMRWHKVNGPTFRVVCQIHVIIVIESREKRCIVRVKVYKRIKNAIRSICRKIRSNTRLVNFPTLFFTLPPGRANTIFSVCTKSIKYWKQKPYSKVNDHSRQRERNRFITTRTFFW